MEKKRRARINNCLGQLKTLVLQAMRKDVSIQAQRVWPGQGHHRPTSETPFEWRFASRSMMARFLMVTGRGRLGTMALSACLAGG